MATTTIWTQDSTIAQALGLPEGRYAANFGFLVQQSVSPEHTMLAAQAIKQSGQSVMVVTQAG